MLTQPIGGQTFSVLNESLIKGKQRLNFRSPRSPSASFA
jgi:hypothetical protein